MSRAMKLDLPYLMSDTDRHGNRRLYVRRNGRKVRLKTRPGSDGFLEAYKTALQALETTADSARRDQLGRPQKGTVGWLAARYFAEGGDYKRLVDKSRQARRSCIESCLEEPLKPGGSLLIRHVPVARFGPVHVKMLRDRKAEHPGAANNRRKHLSAMCAWAVEMGLMAANPVRDVKMAKRNRAGGYHTWTVEEVRQYVARHPVGTKACLALALLLFTGARRQDMVKFGRQHVRDGWLRYVPLKTLYKRNTPSQKPWLPILDQIVKSSPCGDLTFLVTEHGLPFSANGIGNKFRDWCDEAGLPQCTAHGLKKIGATLAAEAGATASQLMAVFDWTTLSQAKVYTDAADRKRMAGEAMSLIAEQPANIFLPHLTAPPKKTDENQ